MGKNATPRKLMSNYYAAHRNAKYGNVPQDRIGNVHVIPPWPKTLQPKRKDLVLRTHCNMGHEYTPENTRQRKDGGRKCKKCHTIWQAAYKERKRQEGKKLGPSICRYGHGWTEENTYIRKDTGAKMCKQCGVDKQRIRVALKRGMITPETQLLMDQRDARLKGLPITDLEDEVKKDNLAYLKLSEEAAQAETNFTIAVQDKGQPKCYRDPGPWQDYDDENPPSQIEAAKLCIGCPVFEECAIFALLNKPTHGVWAGERWQDSDKVGVGQKVYKI